MRRFALTALVGVALLDCFLACSGQYLSSQVRQFAEDHGTKLPATSIAALSIPSWFYLLAVVAIVAALLGFARKLGDGALVYAVAGLLLLDIVALLAMLWGVGLLLFPWYDRIQPA